VVAVPISVDGQLWGAVLAARTTDTPLPPDTEARLSHFNELLATAIANAEARAELARLAEEQAALRRVATLIAQGVEPAAVYAAVTLEVVRLFHDVEPAVVASIVRIDPGPEFELVGSSEPQGDLPLGSRWAAREGFPRQIGSPILIDGSVWGVLTISASSPLPATVAARLETFTELVATAVANAKARGALERLAEEQAALRRAATLVAQGGAPATVFDGVASEIARLLGAVNVLISRYEPGSEATILAFLGPAAWTLPPGTRTSHAGQTVMTLVRDTERPARWERYEEGTSNFAKLAVKAGAHSVVGAPIRLEGRLWGVVSASWEDGASPPPETEERMAKFAELLETAIANAAARDQLAASRLRLLTAADDARRRVVRDLHDGAQQQFVHSIVNLKLAKSALDDGDGEAGALLVQALALVRQGNAELRELAHGILPAALTHKGLAPAVDTVVSRLDLLVEVEIPEQRFPPEIEASAYFIIAESLTNVAKHAHAGHAAVTVSVQDDTMHVEVRDDGVGGADARGHGLVGLSDRATVLGGRLEVRSPASGGTRVLATLPLTAN
jgi:signal transduction histidine kinase